VSDARGITRTLSLRSWDLLLLWASLIVIVGLAWSYLILLAHNMSVNTMSGMRNWTLEDYFMMFIMWAVMMIGMMVPTSIRAVKIYSRIAKKTTNSSNGVAATYWFILGYIIIWTGFSILAAALQGVLSNLGMLSPMMVSSSSYLGASLLIAAGLYQLTPWKDACLTHCQSPAMYLAGRFGPRVIDGIKLGVQHGAYCLGCCWLIMSLLFVGGVMNLLWIAAITGLVLFEKLLPPKIKLTRISAVLMIGAGTMYFVIGL
jgi:predicted metal-binding membrane protein|tara:strand:+ start:968 stop:1744 length:777 start_codon:yes stop_codon:yes gene_type:complete